MPVSFTDVDNGSKNICHHSDDDWRGANSNFVQRTVLSYALCQEQFYAVGSVTQCVKNCFLYTLVEHGNSEDISWWRVMQNYCAHFYSVFFQ